MPLKGRTTSQIENAPRGATYVVPEGMQAAFRDLVNEMGRSDLRVLEITAGNVSFGPGHHVVVVDHSVEV